MSTEEEAQDPLPGMGDMTLEENPPRIVSTWDDPNPQLSSPLFDGRIPGEIRNLIFDLALTETTFLHADLVGRDLDVRPNHDPDPASEAADVVHLRGRDRAIGNSLWPGLTGPNIIHTSLLRTCRLVYLETAHLPSRHKQIVYYGTASDWFPQSGPLGDWQPLKPRGAKPSPMLPLPAITALQRAHLFLPLSYLESQFEPLVRRSFHRLQYPLPSSAPTVRIFSTLVHLRLTLRRTAWRGWNEPGTHPGEPARALEINPFANDLSTTTSRSTAPGGARGAMAAAMDNPSPVAEPGSWASVFAMMPALQTLTIDFETGADRVAEMEGIVAWARRAWRFAVLRNPPEPVYADPETGVEGSWYMSGLERFAGGRWVARHDILGREAGALRGLPTADGRPVRRAWLTAEDGVVERWKWRWFPGKWAGFCPCEAAGGGRVEGCEDCEKRRRLKEGGKGPRLFVWTVTWTAKEEEVEGVVPPPPQEEERGVVLPAKTKEEEESRYNYTLLF
ncbi:hypothetical protein B0T18DRAFT_425670 [Schizothecium vesticola]|uniref:Uncharacterized protein n=1 Tax=Schizothecium vesticola TaxID=314040 RepID=A0AA40F475_9PEZI|nr:hypothetical protein B0T18DRAFT_425670 [Schizothecium vesticola]